MDKVSYALGIGIGRQLASMGAESLNIDDFAQAVKDAIAGVAGVKAVEVDLASNSATVDYDEAKTKTSDLAAAVKAAGFELKD